MKHRILNILLAAAALLGASSCINDDLQECPNDYYLNVRFEKNMLFVDAFSTQVRSIDMWAFNSETGQLAYKFSQDGEALAVSDYTVKLPIPAGEYDVVCWGGMHEDDCFELDSYEPANITELIARLKRLPQDSPLNDLFHGIAHLSYSDNNVTGSAAPQTRTLYLTRNTNRINVVLINIDGTLLRAENYEVNIHAPNGVMRHDNSMGSSERVKYSPWAWSQLTAGTDTQYWPDHLPGSPNGVLAEMSVARLMANHDQTLSVTRKSDNKEIIRIPLIQNLLLYRGQYHGTMVDQEWLDRNHEFTLTFILDNSNNWNAAAMIYINSWAVLPIQYQNFD